MRTLLACEQFIMATAISTLFWIFTSLFLIKNPNIQGATSSFQRRARETIKLVEEHFYIEHCFNSAREEIKNEKYRDRYYAALWVNMYSRDCMINKEFITQDKGQNTFPFRLNKELRCIRNNKRNLTMTDAFVKVKDIINESLGVLGSKTYSTLYRGMKSWSFDRQDHFLEDGYFSASSDATPALKFADGNIFLIVKSTNGVNIENFVQKRFRYQKEVVGKSGKMFKIERKVTDKSEIKQIVATLNVKWDMLSDVKYPDKIVYIREIPGTHNKTLSNQQWKNMENYCLVQDTASDAPEVHDINITRK